MKRTKDKCSYHDNKKMNGGVYKLRRQVMNHIYDVKNLIANFPRVTVRITDTNRKEVVATARMNACVIWVTDKAFAGDENYLRTIVYHEILHAAYGIDHNDNCPLMCKAPSALTKTKATEILLKHLRKN